jgi:hypothetical protein
MHCTVTETILKLEGKIQNGVVIKGFYVYLQCFELQCGVRSDTYGVSRSGLTEIIY